MAPPTYTVVLREECFTLSDSQIRFDSPNSFTGHFLGGTKGGHTSVLYTDRRPTCFPLIQEWLSGYDDILDKPLKGMSEQETLKALLAEARFFKLAGLEARALKALKKVQPVAMPMYWPYVPGSPQDGEFFQPSQRLRSFRQLAQEGCSYHEAEAATRGNSLGTPTPCWVFRDLQLRIDCRTLDKAGLPEVGVFFLHPEDSQLARAGGVAAGKSVSVKFWDSATQQASFDVDDAPTTLAVLLRYCVSPTAGASKTPALQSLADYLRLDLTPISERIAVVRARLAIGYWSAGKLRLLHVKVAMEDQGYRRCWQALEGDPMAAKYTRVIRTGYAAVLD